MRFLHDNGIGSDDDEPYAEQLAALRRAVLRADPSVLFDGRFEEMFSSPTAVFEITSSLLERLAPEQRTCDCTAAQSPTNG